MQTAIALQVFSASFAKGDGVLEACDLAAACTDFTAGVVRKWAVQVIRDYFGVLSSIDDVTDERLELELSSGRGKHSKWVSIMEKGYMKGTANLTLQKFVSWVKEERDVEVCTSTASLWLHDLGF
jgi:hypothetical protein